MLLASPEMYRQANFTSNVALHSPGRITPYQTNACYRKVCWSRDSSARTSYITF